MLTTPPRSRAGPAGFTTIELLTVVLILGLLAVVALPAFTAQVRKARRADARVALVRIQQAQERYRATHTSHAASLSVLGLTATSPAGHYQLATATDTATQAHRYTVSAEATGAQADDADCRFLRLVADGATLTQQSGATASYDNDASTNRACWPA